MWPFSKKTETRADTDPESGQIVSGDDLLTALISRETVTKQMAMELPTARACVDLIAGTISTLPIRLYRMTDGKPEEITDDPRVFLVNNDTLDTLTSVQFWRAMLDDYFFGHGGYAYINRSGLDIISLHYVREESVSINKNSDPIFKNYTIEVNGSQYEPYSFLKILRRTDNGMRGKPIFETNPLLLQLAYAQLKYEDNLVRKGGNKRGFLKSSHKLSEPSMQSLKSAFRRLYANEENVVVLNEGLDFQESSNTSVEMQLNENKKTNAGEICKIFGVPESMFSGNPSEEDRRTFIRTCVAVMTDIECSLDRDLLLETEKRTHYWAFDTRELTRGDTKERYEAYKIGLDENFLQIDEVRQMEDLEPIGFNWLTVGLDAVLINPKTREVYTPNTNATQQLDDLEIESRAAGDNVLVVGPPGSGKTTWVESVRKPDEIVIDLDMMRQALLPGSGEHDVGHDADSAIPVLLAMRGAALNAIGEGRSPSRAYIITGSSRHDEIQDFAKRSGAEVHVMDTTLEECLARIDADPTRTEEAKALQSELARKWFENWQKGGEMGES